MGFHSSTYKKLQKLVRFEDLSKNKLLNVEDKIAYLFLENFIKMHNDKVCFW